MFKTKCAVCGKDGWVFAKDKLGTLPVYYCPDRKCESEAKDKRRFIDPSRLK